MVHSSDPAFEAATVESLAQWLFAPHLVAGVAVEWPDQQLVMRFALE